MRAVSCDLSLVIPLFNEREVFGELLARVAAVVGVFGDKGVSVEVVMVDDGSADGTAGMIKEACGKFDWCRGVALSRNFGHQVAITAGMQYAGGRAVALLDGDLQDPPEVIAEFYGRLQEGYEVVYAVRRDRKEGILKRVCYAGFYRLMRNLATIPIPLDSGDFCIMSRRVVGLMNAMPERHRFVRGLRSWVGFRQVGHSYPRAAREKGQSKYSFGKLLKLAFDGIFTFSEKPLQWSTMMGLVIAFLSFCWGVYVLVWRIFGNPPPGLQGWATLSVGMFFLGGVQLISIGILGEYIGRIHNEVKGRPLFVVEEEFNVGAAPTNHEVVKM